MKKIKSYTSIWSVEKVIYAINDFQLPFPLTFSQMAWFVSQKTFDGKKPFGFLKSAVTFALRPKVTYAGKAIRLKKERFNPVITTVRSVMYVPD